MTRDQIVNTILDHFQGKIVSNKSRIASDRKLLGDPHSESDRGERAEQHRLVMNTIASQEAELSNNVAFIAWLERQEHTAEDPLAPGNIWVLATENERMMWLVYDPNAVRPGMEAYVTIADAEVQQQLGVDQVSTLSVNCPLYGRLIGKDIGEGSKITIGVEGNEDHGQVKSGVEGDDTEIIRIVQIL